VVVPFREKVSLTVLRLSQQSTGIVQAIGQALYTAAACLIRFSAIEAGLAVLCKLSEVLQRQLVPPKLYSSLCRILAAAIAANDCTSSRLVIEAIIGFVPSSQEKPENLTELFIRAYRILSPEKQFLCLQWLRGEV
jgi:hypothetical protein